MGAWLVTVKLPRNPGHDPQHKVTGPCPVWFRHPRTCTDVTGQHHTVLVSADSAELAAADALVAGFHITRIEEV